MDVNLKNQTGNTVDVMRPHGKYILPLSHPGGQVIDIGGPLSGFVLTVNTRGIHLTSGTVVEDKAPGVIICRTLQVHIFHLFINRKGGSKIPGL